MNRNCKKDFTEERKIVFLVFIFIYIVASQLCFAGAKNNEAKPKARVVIFHAGSLSIPFKEMEKDFERLHPDIDIQREPSGSQKAVRKIIDLKKTCDIIASADYRIIDNLLIPEYADWDILFANNQMVLCYTKTSKYADKINKGNWYRILQKKDIVWGYADPNIDPCGYRALMVMQLAERYYNILGLYDRLMKNGPKKSIRPKSVELISLLQTGNIDYAWEYRSVAVQNKLKFITLPDEINLGNYKYDNIYSKAAVKVTGKKPGTTMVIRGKSIIYGITILKSAPEKKQAIDFLTYMLNPEGGLKILKEMGQPPIIPPKVRSSESKKILPAKVRSLVDPEN